MSPGPIPPFDVGAALPQQTTTLIEASAGTGKTYALAALAARYVAEHGIPIDQILLVTFTRAATAELRARIRQRLVEAADHLAAPAPAPAMSDDPVLALLADCDETERQRRVDRLTAAVSAFDTASISTIHGFCAQVRSALGILSRTDADSTVVGSDASLIAQASADLYVRALAGSAMNPLGDRKLDGVIQQVTKARTLTGCVVEAASGDQGDLRAAELIRDAVAEVDARLARQGALSYDSLLTSVRDALRADAGLVSVLRSQFRVAMIDEFQDTDPVQWEIFRTVFAPTDDVDRPTLILVGDPKQAIYSFRGGDVYTYLDARESARVQVLATNQRSDRRVLDAMNGLAEGDTYGETDIAYHSVEVAARNEGRHVVMGDGTAAPGVEVRTLLDPAVLGRNDLKAAPVRRAIGADLACVTHRLLTETTIRSPGRPDRPVRPGDIAVLVGSTADAAPMAEGLRAAGIPYVLRLRDDVADSPAAHQWRTLLHALDRPASTTRATAAALTWFFGWAPAQVAAAIDADAHADGDPARTALLDLQVELGQWSDLLSEQGMPALHGTVRRSHDLVGRLLQSHDGERNLTDLEHLAELIHTELGGRRGVSAGTALAVLDGLGGTPEDELAAEVAQRRIDSDAEAVQILTIHGSKGLEFPFVLLPTLWSGGQRVQARAPYTYYDRERGTRVVDVSTQGLIPDRNGDLTTVRGARAFPELAEEVKRQSCGDQHRLTYVAMTRAIHQTVVWWSHAAGTDLAGLARVLFGAHGIPAGEKVDVPKGPEAIELLQQRRRELGLDDALRIHEITELSDPASLAPIPSAQPGGPPVLGHADLGRRLRRLGKVWSFSSLAAEVGDGHQAVGSSDVSSSDPTADGGAERGAADEVDLDGPAEEAAPSTDGWSRPSPFDGLAGGKDFGTLVHHLFEAVDLASPDPRAAFASLLDGPLGSRLDGPQGDQLADALALVVSTPLGEAFGGIHLGDLRPGDHLDELDFHLPLAPEDPVSAARIGEVIADHLPDEDPLGSWARTLAAGLAGIDLQGFLTGSIDLTLRFPGAGGTRYSVVDYKTNTLSPAGATGRLGHYRRSSMTRVMATSSYALQAVIYSVALHRYLRWRLPGYAPERHLGPVGYLFVRGMAGSDTPIDDGGPAGVFAWDLPSDLVVAVSDLFAGDSRDDAP